VALRKKPLEELKSDAFAERERRGYDVRGKTTTQIREVLRARKRNVKSVGTLLQSDADDS
ncbi:MAG: hypothetical protein WBE94_09690, partial [Pseudolabrys sp.]